MTSSASSWNYPANLATTDKFGQPSIDKEMTFYFGTWNGTNASLVRASESPAVKLAIIPVNGQIRFPPILGSDGFIYTVDGLGEVTAWDTGLHPLWTLPSSLVGLTDTAPVLDCARNTSGVAQSLPGALYVFSKTNGALFNFIVDSHRADGSATWAQYQHDARHTGNTTTAVPNCP